MAWQTTHPSLLSQVRDPANNLAWHTFENRYGDLIVRYCMSRGLQVTDAEDIRQAVMMSLSRSLRNFTYQPTKGRFRSYLARVVRNAISRMAKCPQITVEDLDIFIDTSVHKDSRPQLDDVDEVWEREWMEHHMRLALHKLRQSLRPKSLQVFERLLAGATLVEAAEEFDLTTEGVKKIRLRVRDRLKEEVSKQLAEEESID